MSAFLDEASVLELAARAIQETIGADCRARFYVAGGAFKTILTGAAAYDLDVRGATPEDRRKIVSSLIARGARQVGQRPFGEAFEIGGRVVDVPWKAADPTLETLLARYDIALSAVGVDRQADGASRAFIHPLAVESIRRREILLLKPLVNWHYALTTLERMRRYASELGYRIPPEEEAEVWRVFDEQDDSMRQGMVERFEKTTRGDARVREEIRCRHR